MLEIRDIKGSLTQTIDPKRRNENIMATME
jgi:hypothetical protein